MFNKEAETNKSHGAETVIGPSIKVKGDFHGEGDIIIEGSVEGEISTKQHIAVGKNAIILANIKANSARIAGSVDGNISVSGYLEILATAKINGNIAAKELSVEKGAFIEGDLKMSGHNNIELEK